MRSRVLGMVQVMTEKPTTSALRTQSQSIEPLPLTSSMNAFTS